MTPERWEQISEILEKALSFEGAAREHYLADACRGDAELRAELDSLLQSHVDAGRSFLDVTGSRQNADSSWDKKTEIGRRIGPYLLQKEIGRGGMGEVFAAVRADGQFRKNVALKLVRSGYDAGSILDRFRNERQILAGLDNPNIARLLDGGTTEDGVPYLVMELVDGISIDAYCDERKLSVTKRLQLFEQVCAAVQYAHQRLVIHRDLKPSNILVTADGTPKLVDFGIAKLLDASGQAEVTMLRPMTPEYASPEQVRGEAVSTASDVYSLGVVLYQLLTGRSPYALDARTPAKLANAITHEEPERPSTSVHRTAKSVSEEETRDRTVERIASMREDTPVRLRKRLQGDLDCILLKALRKEPQKRYSSVEQFAGDIHRHLTGLPILARKGTTSYRVSKFVGRHKAAALASGAALLAICGGFVAALYEAHVAHQQAAIAREQRMRAERRFADVRKLANSLIFEIHDSIQDLSGATPARKILVDRAVEYLDSLSREANGDPGLQSELAAAYERLGDVMGYGGRAHLGDFAGAIENYKKAAGMREVLVAADPKNLNAQSDLFNDYFRLSLASGQSGRQADAREALKKALPIAERLVAASPEPRFQDALAGVHWSMGNLLMRSGEFAGALKEFQLGAAVREPLARDPKANPIVKTHLAADYNGIGQMLWRTGKTEQAIAVTRQGLQLLEELSKASPNDATLREFLGETYGMLYPLLEKQGDLDALLDCARKEREVFQELANRDPANYLAKTNLAFSEDAVGQALIRQGKIREGIPYVRRAIKTFKSQASKTPSHVGGLAESYFGMGRAYEAMAKDEMAREKKAHLQEACGWFQRSVITWEQHPQRGAPDPWGGRQGDRARAALKQCRAELAKP